MKMLHALYIALLIHMAVVGAQNITNQTSVGYFTLSTEERDVQIAEEPSPFDMEFSSADDDQFEEVDSNYDIPDHVDDESLDPLDKIEMEVKKANEHIRPILIAIAMAKFKEDFEQYRQKTQAMLRSIDKDSKSVLKQHIAPFQVHVVKMVYARVKKCHNGILNVIKQGLDLINDALNNKTKLTLQEFNRVLQIQRALQKQLIECTLENESIIQEISLL